MKISIGCDHGGFNLKQQVLNYLQNKYEVIDYGCHSLESCDYPVFAKKVAEDVSNKISDFGVLICTTGIGMSITANKFKGSLSSAKDAAKSMKETINQVSSGEIIGESKEEKEHYTCKASER